MTARYFVAMLVLTTSLILSAEPRLSLEPRPVPLKTHGSIMLLDSPGERWWADLDPLCELRDEDRSDCHARVWAALSSGGILFHFEATDDVHVGDNSGKSVWKNDCFRVGVDAWGDGTRGNDPDMQFYGMGDSGFCVSLTDQGPKLWMEYSSSIGGRGMRDDIAPKISRDEKAKTTVYDLTIPWAEFALDGPTTNAVGLAVYCLDNDSSPEESKLRWDNTVNESWNDRCLCGMFKPGKFYLLGVQAKGRAAPAFSIVNRMLNDEKPGIEVDLLLPGRSEVKVSFDGSEYPFSADAGYSRMTLTPGKKISGSKTFSIETGGLSGTAIIRPDYRSDWFAFNARSSTEPGTIGMADWLDAPAGKYGFLKAEGRNFVFENGKPFKIWGVNIGSGTMFRHGKGDKGKKALAKFAKFYAKYGINCLRIHKHMENSGGIYTRDSLLEYDQEKIDLYEYFTAELRKNGIYHGLSGVFHLRPGPDDKKHFRYPEDIYVETRGRGGSTRVKSDTYCLSSFAPDVQDFHIKQVVDLLNRENKYTGLRYADDPSLAYVELRNEDSIFFYATQGIVLRCPNYKKMFCGMFSDWLRKKYDSQAALEKAWGKKAFNCWDFCFPNESIGNRNIFPICNAWWYSPEGLQNQEEQFGCKRRLLDTARFLYEVQTDFYKRFVKKIRATGYRGAIVGSCWWAGSGVSHFYNLYSDYQVGYIDRHEYYGGGGAGGRGGFEHHSPLASPGTGSLQEGFNQVMDRPFGLSEWIGVNPYPWAADGVPLISVYGLGLQGWDSSFHFASSQGAFGSELGNRWNVMQPVQLGQYPVFARMVYRRDVGEAPVVSKRNVHMDSLGSEGKIGFFEEVAATSTADFNAIRGDIPLSALAAGRTVVDFTGEFRKTEVFDIGKYMENGKIKSATGQLEWIPKESMPGGQRIMQWYDQQGYFSVDTPATKALVGFAPKQKYEFGEITIEPDNLFAVIALTAINEDGKIATDDRLLLSAVARSLNDNAEFFPSHSMAMLKKGGAPIKMEPVRAEITLKRDGIPTVYILDHDGMRTERRLEVKEGSFHIDTGRDSALYYEIVF